MAKILWTYEPHLPADPLGEVICCGWDNRGVAIGDGLVFVSQLNGLQVALDQRTGKVAWSTPVVAPKSGFSITSAPLYYEDTVYVGGSGGEYGVRGRLTALDVKTGKIKWRTYMIPGPGEPGDDSWPKTTLASTAARHLEHAGGEPGAGPCTSRPRTPRLTTTARNGRRQKWAASIVAMDAKTGKIKWGYQKVHHDLWDYDSPSPTVLVKGEMDGKEVEAVGEPAKTGWVYLVDRRPVNRSTRSPR